MVITDSVPNAGERDFQPFRLRTQRQEQPQLSCAWACRYGRYPYSNDRGVRRMVFQVQAFCKLKRKVFWQQWSRVGAPRNELPAPAFLSNPLDHGDFGESRKLCASMNAPARQSIQQLHGDLERGERKGTDTCGFVPCGNNGNAR